MHWEVHNTVQRSYGAAARLASVAMVLRTLSVMCFMVEDRPLEDFSGLASNEDFASTCLEAVAKFCYFSWALVERGALHGWYPSMHAQA